MTEAAPTPRPEPPAPPAMAPLPWQRWLGLGGVYLFVVALLLAGRALHPGFWSSENLLQVVRDVAMLGIVAVGVSFITVSGHYVDLSIPGIMAVAGIVAVALLPYGFVWALAAGLAVGLAIGLVNGLLVGYLRLNPIIWTLVALALSDGITRWAYGGVWKYADQDTAVGALFSSIYRAEVLGHIPLVVVLFAATCLLAHLTLHNTVFGRQLILTGSAYEAARITGINVRRVVLLAFVLSSFTAALAGIIKTSMSGYGEVEIGVGYDFQAITAVVLGGVTLAGGRGSILGVLGGVLVIGLLGRVLPLIEGVGQDQQLAIRGALFVVVVALSAYANRRAGRSET